MPNAGARARFRRPDARLHRRFGPERERTGFGRALLDRFLTCRTSPDFEFKIRLMRVAAPRYSSKKFSLVAVRYEFVPTYVFSWLYGDRDRKFSFQENRKRIGMNFLLL